MLFILSLISERITNFVKLQFRKTEKDSKQAEKEIKITAAEEKKENKKKERKTLNIALLCGMLTALIVKANLFALLNSNNFADQFIWGWDWIDVASIGTIIYTVVGCLLTGIFLSFGSKFWHDVLDLLFQAKALSKKLVDKKTYQAQNIKEFDEYLATSELELAKKAIKQNEKELKNKFPNILDIKVGLVGKESTPVVSIVTSASKEIKIPNILEVELESGRIVEVETDVLYTVEKL